MEHALRSVELFSPNYEPRAVPGKDTPLTKDTGKHFNLLNKS